MNLLPNLRKVADVWVSAHQLTNETITLKTLGVRAAQNSKLFERKQMSVGTLEAVAYWLSDPVNWPAGAVPPEAALILLDWGISIPEGRIADRSAAA